MGATEVIEAHRNRGRSFEADGLTSFVLDEGSGAPVVCMHGVPTSSFLWRKVVPELAGHGLRGVAFDLPGLGLADRPEDFDYSWSGLGRWATSAIDALDLDRFHLVVHDIGGPVGFEVATAIPDRIMSLTVLNTMIDVANFTKPWTMRPFEVPALAGIHLATSRGPLARLLFRRLGIQDNTQVSNDELDAVLRMLRTGDGGRAFLRIMQSFETTVEKGHQYASALQDTDYPIQIIWGENDPALRIDVEGATAQRLSGVEQIHRLPGKHFLQEDCAPALAELIAKFTAA